MLLFVFIVVIASFAIGQRQFYVFFDKDNNNVVDSESNDDNHQINRGQFQNAQLVANFAVPQLMKAHLRGMNTLEQGRIKQIVSDAKDIICQELITTRLKIIHESAVTSAKRGGTFANNTVCNNQDIKDVSTKLQELFTGGAIYLTLNAVEVNTMIQEATLDILMLVDQRVEAKLRQCFPDCAISVSIENGGACIQYDVVW